MIQQLGRALARIREMLLGGTSTGAAVRAEIAATAATLFGRDSAMLERLDAESAVRLIASPERVALWVQLLDAEAESWDREGGSARASACRARATALRQASENVK
ncbi:hypothetical protein [Gemmatimonas phototrophica]|nr:hypothetical protein [Gemmatimonas phototrophica]